MNTYPPWASVSAERNGLCLLVLSLILTVAPASGTLFVPDEPPGAKANSFVIVPWRTRWGDGVATPWMSATLATTAEPVGWAAITLTWPTSVPFSNRATFNTSPAWIAPLGPVFGR